MMAGWKEENRDYEAFYLRITTDFRESKQKRNWLVHFNTASKYVMYIGYAVLLLFSLWNGRVSTVSGLALGVSDGSMESISAFQIHFLKCLLIPAIGFLLETILRAKINRKRPYESFSIQPLILKNTKGKSFPSRHVFSATIISMAWLYMVPAVGAVMLLLTLAIAWVRVAAGVHYPSDVAAGGILGVLIGLIFFL